MDEAVVVSVILLRFALPFLIPKFPLPGVLACLVLDAADQTIFQRLGYDPPWYQGYDKALDVFYLAIAYISAMRTWRDPVAFQTVRFLYLYRLVGVLLFELLDKRFLLLIFPNTFEYFFIAYESVRTRWNPLRLGARAVVGMAAFIWIVIKLPQEWWIHVAQLDFTEFMADHPYMWGVLAAAALGAGTALYLNRKRIPAPDWPFTVAVDRHLPPIEPAGKPPLFSNVLVEKIAFMTIVAVIFSEVLPADSIRSGTLGVTFGVALMVLLNALVSEWLHRRGHSWTTAGSAFLAMLAINTGLVFADSLLDATDRGGPTLITWFFVVLLSALIALFDLMRSTRGESDLRTSAIKAWRAARHQAAPAA